MEHCSEIEAELVVYIHPSQANQISSAISRELSFLLFRHHKIFNGVVVAYNIKDIGNCPRIIQGVHPYLAVKLTASLLLFQPKIDSLIEGKVVKVTQESIHLIVFGFSSAVINFEDVPREFRFKLKHGVCFYVSRNHKKHSMKIGSLVRFVVKSWDEEVLHISGSLMAPGTGNISWLLKSTASA